MTGDEIISAVWELLGDSITPHRYDAADLLSWLDEAEDKLTEARPDLLLTAVGTLTTRAQLTATTQTLTVGRQYRQELIDYVMYRALHREDGATNKPTGQQYLRTAIAGAIGT